jgi:hypothetical protein
LLEDFETCFRPSEKAFRGGYSFSEEVARLSFCQSEGHVHFEMDESMDCQCNELDARFDNRVKSGTKESPLPWSFVLFFINK